jgi:hypothetical protein
MQTMSEIIRNFTALTDLRATGKGFLPVPADKRAFAQVIVPLL